MFKKFKLCPWWGFVKFVSDGSWSSAYNSIGMVVGFVFLVCLVFWGVLNEQNKRKINENHPIFACSMGAAILFTF